MSTSTFIALVIVILVAAFATLRALAAWQKRQLAMSGFNPDHFIPLGINAVAIDYSRKALAYFDICDLNVIEGKFVDDWSVVPNLDDDTFFKPKLSKFDLLIWTMDPDCPKIKVPFTNEHKALQWQIYIHKLWEISLHDQLSEKLQSQKGAEQEVVVVHAVQYAEARDAASASGLTDSLLGGLDKLNDQKKKAAIVEDLRKLIQDQRKQGIKHINQSAIARYLVATKFQKLAENTLRGWVGDAM